ncbi:hypothetical protein Lsan_2656 [Legionella santicrucis]|uniref:Uncharacterized protein n=1 Tax=Legionella santicrucis TaxID=45074 RepID=A0A0W0YJB2_9GAMM|nr:hypothetical protein [Legionella santicrucis]KTD57034.1 hypothetical protein Lsan_2656 [Legionella santicrucis]
MGKNRNENGVWIVTRENITPDSERHIERDDPLFQVLNKLFEGQESHVDFEAIAQATGTTPEQVFINLHENYGYICIGTGENPAIGEKLSDEEKTQRKQAIKQTLESEKIPHILIKGKYMGIEEDSYFIPFNDKTIGLSTVLQGEIVKKIAKIAHAHKQDSLLICQGGHACYLYTSGPQKGCVITGKSITVYPNQAQLPDDCYSLFLNDNGVGTIGFTCALNFDITYSSIDEYVAKENKTLQQYYEGFTTEDAAYADKHNHKKTVILLRGTNGYNEYAVALKALLSEKGLKTAIIGTDANIAKVNEEVARDNLTQGPKANWKWQEVRTESHKRNYDIYQSLLHSDIDVIIYADMNKLVDFMKPYIESAIKGNHGVMSIVINSFVFEATRSDFVEKLCQQYNLFMARHVADFKSEQGQINAKSLTVGSKEILQYPGISANELVPLVLYKQSILALTKDRNIGMFSKTMTSQEKEQRAYKDSSMQRDMF